MSEMKFFKRMDGETEQMKVKNMYSDSMFMGVHMGLSLSLSLGSGLGAVVYHAVAQNDPNRFGQ